MKHSWKHMHGRAQRRFLLNLVRLSCEPPKNFLFSWSKSGESWAGPFGNFPGINI